MPIIITLYLIKQIRNKTWISILCYESHTRDHNEPGPGPPDGSSPRSPQILGESSGQGLAEGSSTQALRFQPGWRRRGGAPRSPRLVKPHKHALLHAHTFSQSRDWPYSLHHLRTVCDCRHRCTCHRGRGKDFGFLCKMLNLMIITAVFFFFFCWGYFFLLGIWRNVIACCDWLVTCTNVPSWLD